VSKLKIVLNPKHPERICWGCDKYCPSDDLRCGNGTIRTQHPVELFGEDWLDWELNSNSSCNPELSRAEEMSEHSVNNSCFRESSTHDRLRIATIGMSSEYEG